VAVRRHSSPPCAAIDAVEHLQSASRSFRSTFCGLNSDRSSSARSRWRDPSAR
jgi:hypothetical protein